MSHPRERRAKVTDEEMRASLEARIKMLEELVPSMLRAIDEKTGSKTSFDENVDLSNKVDQLKRRTLRDQMTCRGQEALERGTSKPKRTKGRKDLSIKSKKSLPQ